MSWAMTRSICGNQCLIFLKVLDNIENSWKALMANSMSQRQELQHHRVCLGDWMIGEDSSREDTGLES